MLQPAGQVDCIANGRIFAGRADHPQQDRPGVDPDAYLDILHQTKQRGVHFAKGCFPVFELGLHSQRCPDGPLRVILLSDRSSEQGHHGIADVLIDKATLVEDGFIQPSPERVDDFADLFMVELLRHAGESRDIRKQHADQFALLRLRTPLGSQSSQLFL